MRKTVTAFTLVAVVVAISMVSRLHTEASSRIPAPAPRVADSVVGQGAKAIGGIEASNDVQAILEKIRASLGGQRKLLGVRSLALEATETFEGSKPRNLSQMLLLPDRFQENYAGYKFTLNGGDYWQVPVGTPEVHDINRKRHTKSFAAQALLFLLRTSAAVPLKASRMQTEAPGTIWLAFDGPDSFRRELEVDQATMRPKSYKWPNVVTQGDRRFEGTATMVIDEYKQIDGIWFPVRTTSKQDGVPIAVRYDYLNIRVDQGVNPADFVQPKQ